MSFHPRMTSRSFSEIDRDSKRCGQSRVAPFLKSHAIGLEVRLRRACDGPAIGPGDADGTREVYERGVKPDDNLILMLGLQSDRIVFYRRLDAPV